MEKEGCGIISGNGRRLVNFCEDNNLVIVIGGTIFQLKNVDIARWIDLTPDRSYLDKQEMDRDTTRRKSLTEVTILKLRKAKKVEQRSRLPDMQKLTNPLIKRAFKLEFEVLQDQ